MSNEAPPEGASEEEFLAFAKAARNDEHYTSDLAGALGMLQSLSMMGADHFQVAQVVAMMVAVLRVKREMQGCEACSRASALLDAQIDPAAAFLRRKMKEDDARNKREGEPVNAPGGSS